MLLSVKAEAVVDFVGEDENVVIDSDGSKAFELLSSEHLADGIVRSIKDDDLGLGSDSSPQLIEVDRPILSLGLLSRLNVLGRMQWDVDGHTAVEDDARSVLVEEGLDADDLITLLKEGEKSSVHAC